MRTEYITDDIARAADILLAGGLAAVPTETVYGLAADGLNAAAVERIYAVKGRPESKPLSLLAPGPEALDRYGRAVSRGARVLADRFWPGPLTIVVKAAEGIPPIVLAGGDTVGLRCPASPMTLALLRTCGRPLAAPSANPSGAPSPKTVAEVAAYFDGKIEAILDGGPCGVGVESTIADLAAGQLRILRQGALPEADIREALLGSLQIIGITGGTGAGKSTALEVLRDRGALVLDADRIYHELLSTGGPMVDGIAARFPGTVTGGVLDRKALGARVFADPAALESLSVLTQGFVIAEIERRLADFAVAGGEIAAVDAISLIGGPLERRFCALVGVLADEDVRVRRLVDREGVSADYARARIRAQRPDSFFREHCSHILMNNGSREDFRRACGTLFDTILEA